jgi:hypothetical protein
MIMRTYHCPECNHRMEQSLTQEQWDSPPPSCEACDQRMNQEFRPPAIGGSIGGKARALAEDIIANDYHVANIQFNNRQGGTSKVRYKDETASTLPSDWQKAGHAAMLQTAIGIGQQNRREFGMDGLDMLKRGIASGAQPDLIEASKRRAIKVW